MRVPIIIGVGDVKNRSLEIEDALEPLELMLEAVTRALADTALAASSLSALRSQIDSLDVVRTWTWPYPDLPGLLSQRLGVSPKHRSYSEHGGNQPVKLLDEAAGRIARGETNVAVVTGGEALASLSAFAKAGKMPPSAWTKLPNEVTEVASANRKNLGSSVGATHGIGTPIQVYPLYENGFRAHRNQSIHDNNIESARLYAEFAKIAEGNEVAWSYGQAAETEESIGTVGKRNRLICFPYPLLMNAFNTVNLAGACILTSTEYAKELGISESKWIYPLGGAGTSDSDNFWQRPNFYCSPSISRSLSAGLRNAGLDPDQIDLYDFYSCFPIVPKLACEHLDLPVIAEEGQRAKPITLLGGLTSFGGAGNNYSMHAITEMARQLRAGGGKNGLILANGGQLSYQHVIILSTSPRPNNSSYPKNPLPSLVQDWQLPVVDEAAEGDAVVETYTVEFGRDGKPEMGYVVGRLKSNGHRFVANHGDEKTLMELASVVREPIGRWGIVRLEGGGRNLFCFDDGVKL